jgi:hypothetical protein
MRPQFAVVFCCGTDDVTHAIRALGMASAHGEPFLTGLSQRHQIAKKRSNELPARIFEFAAAVKKVNVQEET